MVGKRRDLKQRTTRYRSPTPREEPKFECDPLGGPCNVWGSFCKPPYSDPGCCSSLMFMLDSACQACTGSTNNQTWEEYIEDDAAHHSCDSSTPSPSPSNLPAMTATNVVPQWAIAMALATPNPSAFDFDAAVSLNKNPSTPASQSSSTAQVTQQTSSATSLSSTSISTSVTSPTLPSATSSQPNSSQSSAPGQLESSSKTKVPVGAIAGGIIGGLVLLGLIGVGLFYLRRRRRGHPMAPSAAYKAALRAGNQSPSPYQIVHGHSDSVDNSTEDLTQGFQRPASWISSRPISIHSESRFHEHTTSS